MSDAPDPYVVFRDRLIEAGIIVPGAVRGLYGKARPFVEVYDGITRFVSEVGAQDSPELFRFPALMPREHFLKTDYLRSFPDLVGSVHSFAGGNAEHATLLNILEDGGDWARSLDPTELMLTPAACYPIYGMLSGRGDIDGRRFDVLGTCFRHEGSDDPARLMMFSQHEQVFVGSPDDALAHRNRWLERALEMMTDLGLDVRSEVANDPFFGRAGRMLSVSQREAALKYEIVATVADAERPTAIVSCNCHLDHLTVPFDIHTSDGELANSSCVGFGLERIVGALFSRHGMDLAGWPQKVRDRLLT